MNPFDITGKIAAKLIPEVRLIVYKGAPHGLFETEKDKLTKDLIKFISE